MARMLRARYDGETGYGSFLTMIYLEGLDHRSSIDERERLLASFRRPGSAPHVTLSTCNRVQQYSGEGSADESISRTLFRIAAGLESKLIGEGHILCQVRRALNTATESATISSGLSRLFQSALRCGKRVRAETDIAKGAMSHSHAAVAAILQINGTLSGSRITVIGANRITEHAVHFLKRSGANDLCIVNRSASRAEEIASKYSIKAFSWDQFDGLIRDSDIILTATSSAEPIIVPSQLTDLSHPLLIVDLAVPRDVEPHVGKIKGITLLNIEDIESRIDQHLELRRAEITDAERIVEEELAIYLSREANIR